MRNRKAELRRAAAVGGIMLLALGSVPAFAEGYKKTKLINWATGDESKRWEDNNYDNARTTVRFEHCSTPSSPGTRTSAAIEVHKDVFGPDKDYGVKGNVCAEKKSWGDMSKGKYYFSLEKINGTSGPGTFHLNANPVHINW